VAHPSRAPARAACRIGVIARTDERPIWRVVSADQAAMAIEVHLPADLPRSERREILDRFERLARYTNDPIEGVRITLRRPATRAARRRWVADASLVLNGRRLASHATGTSAPQAAKEAADRLNRQMRRVADAAVALRNDRRAIKSALAHVTRERRHRPRPSLKRPDLRRHPAAHRVSVAGVDARRRGGPARPGPRVPALSSRPDERGRCGALAR